MKNWKKIIAKGEGPKLEFKSTLRVDIKTNKAERFIEYSVLKTLAAFLNSQGGTLLIGVEDSKNILGLSNDFNSFSQADKLDEFQKHFDNIIQKSIGDRFHHYMQFEFPKLDNKSICVITIKKKSSEPIYLKDVKGEERFYIRRQASTIDLKLSESYKYIREHWKTGDDLSQPKRAKRRLKMFYSNEAFQEEFKLALLDKNSAYYREIRNNWNSYSLRNGSPFLSKVIKEFLPKSISFGLLPVLSDFARKHLYNDRESKYIYNQPHIYMHNSREEGYDFPIYYHIQFIGILYATAILDKIDIDIVSKNNKNMQSIYSG